MEKVAGLFIFSILNKFLQKLQFDYFITAFYILHRYILLIITHYIGTIILIKILQFLSLNY